MALITAPRLGLDSSPISPAGEVAFRQRRELCDRSKRMQKEPFNLLITRTPDNNRIYARLFSMVLHAIIICEQFGFLYLDLFIFRFFSQSIAHHLIIDQSISRQLNQVFSIYRILI